MKVLVSVSVRGDGENAVGIPLIRYTWENTFGGESPWTGRGEQRRAAEGRLAARLDWKQWGAIDGSHQGCRLWEAVTVRRLDRDCASHGVMRKI